MELLDFIVSQKCYCKREKKKHILFYFWNHDKALKKGNEESRFCAKDDLHQDGEDLCMFRIGATRKKGVDEGGIEIRGKTLSFIYFFYFFSN